MCSVIWSIKVILHFFFGCLGACDCCWVAERYIALILDYYTIAGVKHVHIEGTSSDARSIGWDVVKLLKPKYRLIIYLYYQNIYLLGKSIQKKKTKKIFTGWLQPLYTCTVNDRWNGIFVTNIWQWFFFSKLNEIYLEYFLVKEK